MSLNGRRHPKGDKHGKPIPRDDTPRGCLSVLALIAARPVSLPSVAGRAASTT